LGSATGYSVKEVIAAAEQTLQRTIPKEVKDRRPGDPANESGSHLQMSAIILLTTPSKSPSASK
ncbi:MAG: hypothetical protein NTV33_11945, partial [Coprothermobacterota bacterium]|nr:hypothetical protein [Coprothermobacterota bacterium]